MISVTWHGVDEAVEQIRAFSSKAIPFAARNALNTTAFEARRQWQGEIKRSFVLRNQFTVNSIRVQKVRGGMDVRRMESVVGSVAPYMRKQEFGGTGNRAIPGPAAAGQGAGGKRTRVVRAGLRMSRLNVRRTRHTNKRQFNAIAIAMAKRSGQKAALLHRPGGGKGLFEITGSKAKPKQRLLYAVGRGADRVPATPTLQRTLHRMNARMPAIWVDALKAELKRHGIAGY